MWVVGDAEIKTFFIPLRDKITGKETTIPVTIRRVWVNHKNLDGTVTSWVVQYNRKKFSIHYPDSIRDIDNYGYYRPSGQKQVKNVDTGLTPDILYKKLREKFDKPLVSDIIHRLAGVAI